MTKKFLILLLSLAFAVNVYAQQAINFGQLVVPFSATTLTGSAFNSSAYTLPTAAAGTVTWAVAYGSAPSSITLQIQGSLDNSSWTTIDSTTSTSATSATASVGAYRYIRARVNASSGGTTLTVNFTVKSGGGASSGAAGGGLTDSELRASAVPVVGDKTAADNYANPTDAVPVLAMNMCYDGATWDRCTETSIPAGTAYIGQVGINAVAAGGSDFDAVASAASTNSTLVKNAAGTLYGVHLVNTTATLYYIRFYNLASAPTCSSATGFAFTLPVPASTTGAGFSMTFSEGIAFGTGIGYCITGGPTSTDNTNAAVGIYGVINNK